MERHLWSFHTAGVQIQIRDANPYRYKRQLAVVWLLDHGQRSIGSLAGTAASMVEAGERQPFTLTVAALAQAAALPVAIVVSPVDQSLGVVHHGSVSRCSGAREFAWRRGVVTGGSVVAYMGVNVE